MSKKHSNTAPADQILSMRLDANGTAELLGLSVARINQLRREGTLKPGADGLYAAVDALRSHYHYDSPRGDVMRSHARHRNARALELELGTRRAMRRLLTLLEVRQIAAMIYEQAVEFVDSESNRAYTEHCKSHTEAEARILTGKMYNTLRRIPDAWAEGMMQFCKNIDRDHLPADCRLDDVLKGIIREIEAAYVADQKKLATPTP